MVEVMLNGLPITAEAHLIKGTTFVELRKMVEAREDTVTWYPPATVRILTFPRITVDADYRIPSRLAPRVLDRLLAGAGVLKGQGTTFAGAEATYGGPNAVLMIAHAFLESGRGTSQYARERNNIFGIAAFDDDPDEATRFASIADCVNYYAGWVTRQWLHPWGNRWAGAPTLAAMNRGRELPDGTRLPYATDPEWAQKIVNIANELLDMI